MSLCVMAQHYKISGKLSDQESREGVAYANISIPGSQHGTISAMDGGFIIETDTLPVNLIISHIGYVTKRIWVEKASSPFNILMEPSVELLRDVEITAKNEPIPFFKDNLYAVLDYEIDHDLIYLLIYRFHISKSELLIKSFYGETILPAYSLPFKPTSLFLDCLGYVHVLSKDSIYQVYMGRDSISLIHHHGIDRFHSTLQDCVASTQTGLYFRCESHNRQEVRFYRVDRRTSFKRYIATARDEEKIKMLNRNSKDYYFASLDRIPDDYSAMVEWMWVNRILYKPNGTRMEKIGETLCMFNAVDGTIHLMDLDGTPLSELQMTIGKSVEGDWSKEIYLDRASEKAYTTFNKFGKVTLLKIDLSTGEIDRMLVMQHYFPENIKIHHDHLFYLYDLPGEGDNKHLFKQKL